MEKYEEKKINEDGSFVKTTMTTTDTKDGFVPESEIRTVNTDTYGKYHKGYSKTISFATNDPKVTRPFVNKICGFFVIIALFLIVFLDSIGKFMGVFILVLIIPGYLKMQEDINKIEESLKKKKQDEEN